MTSKTIMGKEIALRLGLTKNDSEEAVNIVFEMIAEDLVRGKEVRIRGFGTFAITEREAHDGRNPFNGEPIKVAAKKSPRFRPAKALRDAMNPVRKVGAGRNSPMPQRKRA